MHERIHREIALKFFCQNIKLERTKYMYMVDQEKLPIKG